MEDRLTGPVQQDKRVKQMIVMRKDLNMRKGKMISQGAHASLGAVLKLMSVDRSRLVEERTLYIKPDSVLDEWLNGIFTKICVYVSSEEELMDVYSRAESSGLNVVLIEDNGLTEFGGVKTKTCIAIGPDFSYRIDPITGSLPLL